MKKFIGLIMVLVMFGLSACNFDTNVEVPNTVTPDDNKDATVTLKVATLATTSERDLMQQWINGYQKKNKNVGLKISTVISSMEDLPTLASDPDNMPDIIWTAGDQHSPYSSDNYFYDLSDESKFPGGADFFADFYDSLIESTHYSSTDDGIWFVPRDYNRLVVYYNKSAFTRANVALPQSGWTWSDFEDTMAALKAAGVKKALEFRGWPPLYTTMVTNFGGKYFEANGSIAIDSTQTKAAYDYLARMADPEQLGYTITGNGAAFMAYDGTLATSVPMIIDVRPQLSTYMQTAHNAGWDLDVAEFPNFEQADGSSGYVAAGCSGYAISTSCTDSAKLAAAWDFLQYCMSQEGYDEVAWLGSIVPALETMRDSGEWTEYTYMGKTVNAAAFTDSNTNDIFLNYYNVLETNKHKNIINLVNKFWDSVGTKAYSTAVQEFIQSASSLLG